MTGTSAFDRERERERERERDLLERLTYNGYILQYSEIVPSGDAVVELQAWMARRDCSSSEMKDVNGGRWVEKIHRRILMAHLCPFEYRTIYI